MNRNPEFHPGHLPPDEQPDESVAHPPYWRQQRWVSLDHFGSLTDRQRRWARTA
ncbi:hypothetical protein ACM0AZ_25105 [Mycobacteroides abscessus subsp. massiliense]|uniref:hypothetical protein n=1 Tax=Mycobacteroides abscessus TaxID=36809 RepID=UPI000925CF2B|nr:hypothetical protein [Mycobacteroides abscessus]MBN7567111.1 hypothetical protein [Mycobacteroides abscessus subsp. massiliense]SIJ96389.1 Uncharacterised protein [Mycobacteroides abscessus subsp. abscessus]